MNNKIELLAPAGDKERAYFALEYGADAIYLGAKQYSLRARASNFELQDIKEIVDYAHTKNKKVYLVTNIICHNSLALNFIDFFKQVANFKIDGFICADPFIINTIAKQFPWCEIHISTQQSITNSKAALFWKKHNAKRVVLAREMTFDEIAQLCQNVKDEIEIEIFIHGAVCISYSGRCMMSNNFSLRDSNTGGCAQSCRWEYTILNNQHINHSFTMSAKDMVYLNYLDKLMELNIKSFKIEGRMKTINYLTTVIKNYRYMLDHNKLNQEEIKAISNNLEKVANRETSTAFLINPDKEKMLYHDEQRILKQTFAFNVVKKIDDCQYEIISKNNFNINQTFIISFPDKDDIEVQLKSIYDIDNKTNITVVNVPMTSAIITLTKPLEMNEFCLGRIKDE